MQQHGGALQFASRISTCDFGRPLIAPPRNHSDWFGFVDVRALAALVAERPRTGPCGWFYRTREILGKYCGPRYGGAHCPIPITFRARLLLHVRKPGGSADHL